MNWPLLMGRRLAVNDCLPVVVTVFLPDWRSAMNSSFEVPASLCVRFSTWRRIGPFPSKMLARQRLIVPVTGDRASPTVSGKATLASVHDGSHDWAAPVASMFVG